MTLAFHHLADIFPLLDEAETTALADDIAHHGLREDIVMLDGKILDGRNRYRACIAAGVEPRTIPFDGDDPAAFVVSVNLRRRHLDESQRAMVAARLATLPVGINQHASIDAPSQTEAARLLNVSRPSVQRARMVIDRAPPEIVAAVEHGEISVSAAADLARRAEGAQQAPLIEQPSSAPEAVRQIRPEPKVVKRALKAKPTLKEAQGTICHIHELACCLNYEGYSYSDLPEDQRLTPIAFWEYLTVAGDDHVHFAGNLDEAIKTLKAIRRAMPRATAMRRAS